MLFRSVELLLATKPATSDAEAVKKNFFIFRSNTEKADTDAWVGVGTVMVIGALRLSATVAPLSTTSTVYTPGASTASNVVLSNLCGGRDQMKLILSPRLVNH